MKQIIERGSYIRLKKDKSQIFKVISFNEEVVLALPKNKPQVILKYSDIEPGDDDDMLTYESGQSIFLE